MIWIVAADFPQLEVLHTVGILKADCFSRLFRVDINSDKGIGSITSALSVGPTELNFRRSGKVFRLVYVRPAISLQPIQVRGQPVHSRADRRMDKFRMI